ncbi:CCA tRNA nucleotidyltransferase [Microvirga antarctica]|uniref:CCA tRNA nucleotidyltransferase n=1 Tax=Microvirga antarctica TaxID=2819233 RepID=UPI001B3031B3|nr:CCA tRNA nucleotidyltransferase [Microvirga antarctica]
MIHPVDHQAPLALLGRPKLRRLLAVLNGGGEETRIVGGAIRNALLGRPVSEVDLATTASPLVTDRKARGAGLKTVPTGIEHGTITVLVEGEPFEVTTLREDVETDGRRAVVHFGRDFAADAHRRDFTINALSLDVAGKIHDYTGGVDDLAARRVRFIGDARTRIREDYLRILRFFRFYAEYGEAEPDAEGLAAAGLERAGLAILSRERVRHEWLKILVARRSGDTLAILSEHGFLTWLIDGAAEMGRYNRACALDSAMPDPIARLAALAVMVREDSDRLRERLRLSNDEHRRLGVFGDLVCGLKSDERTLTAIDMRRLVADHGPEWLAFAMGVLAGEPRPLADAEALATLAAFHDGSETVPAFPLRGADFLKAGIAPGPELGHLLVRAREAWLLAGCPTDEGAAARLMETARAGM